MKSLYFVQPLPYNNPDDFWVRTTGLLVSTLREKGYEATMVVLHPDNPHAVPDPRPALICTLAQLQDPTWWKSQAPDAVVLYLWGAPRFDRIRKAALQATPRVIERLDTSGIRIPRIWPFSYFLITWGLAQLPCVVAECPLAAARTERHIRWHSQAPVRVAQVSNPVDTTFMYYTPGLPKSDAIVTVGRWSSYQKDFPLLLASAVEFLKTHPQWTFDIIDGGLDERLLSTIPREIRDRIHCHGRLSQTAIGDLNRRAKIHFLVSRWESFCAATLEALCCGSSYVGPGDLAGSSYLIENQSGTIAPRRHKMDLADALTVEAAAWETGRRDPQFISQRWTEETGHQPVTARILQLLEAIPASAK